VVIVRDTADGRELVPARWGLVPHWSKEEKPKYSTINARAETLAEKPTYRDSFKRRRCLFPASGFYEWKHVNDQKMPYLIRMPKGELMAFAGLWDRWDKDGKRFDSCSIIVTSANTIMQAIHDRMPVILNPENYTDWLKSDNQDETFLKSMLVPYAGRLDIYPVSHHVNNPKNDDPSCTEKVR
jgi:putative SOS response-associated peptidase YedK